MLENLDKVLKEIENGNDLGEKITLVGATKFVPVEIINQAIEKGLKVVAENKVQEFREKTDMLDKTAEQHFIGHLQKNKVKYLVGKVALIQSVDSLPLAEEISDFAVKRGVIQDILLEVNIGEEESKSGLFYEEVIPVAKAVSALKGVALKGLMAMLPNTDDEKLKISLCKKMRYLYDELKKEGFALTYLSVGMSEDYKTAIKNGSNMIRLGSLIFGQRNYGGNNGTV